MWVKWECHWDVVDLIFNIKIFMVVKQCKNRKSLIVIFFFFNKSRVIDMWILTSALWMLGKSNDILIGLVWMLDKRACHHCTGTYAFPVKNVVVHWTKLLICVFWGSWKCSTSWLIHEYAGVFQSGVVLRFLDLEEEVMSVQVSETEALCWKCFPSDVLY